MKFLAIFIATFLFGFSMRAEYEAKYGWFGVIAEATGYFEKNATDYRIETSFHPVGFVSKISKHMRQKYVSYGKVKDGILIPERYVSHRINDDKNEKKIFLFDHNRKKIVVLKYRFGKLVYKKELPYYVKDDILTLYFNLPKYFNSQKEYTFYALGGRRKDGRIDVEILKRNSLITKIRANLYNKIFVGDRGILFLNIESDNWVTLSGIVKNVLKIGDLKGKLKDINENIDSTE